VEYAAGRHVFYRSLSATDHDRLAELAIPLITPSQKFEGRNRGDRDLPAPGGSVEQRQFRLKKLAKTFFGKGMRDALIAPAGLKSRTGDDELNQGKRRLTWPSNFPRGLRGRSS